MMMATFYLVTQWCSASSLVRCSVCCGYTVKAEDASPDGGSFVSVLQSKSDVKANQYGWSQRSCKSHQKSVASGLQTRFLSGFTPLSLCQDINKVICPNVKLFSILAKIMTVAHTLQKQQNPTPSLYMPKGLL